MRIIITTALLSLATTRADAAPAWCKDVKHDDRSSDLKTALDPDRYPDEVVKALVKGLCDPTDDERAHRAELEAARQQWMKRMAMNDADWASDVMAWFPGDATSYQPPWPNDKAWSSLGAYDQYALLVHPHDNGTGEKHYLADAVSLTAAGRFGYVWNCLHNGGPVEWAICQPDLDALDRTKLGQELRADTTYGPEDRMRARFELAKVDHFLPKHVARVQALFAKDKAYKQLFDLARDTRAAYEARAKDLAPLRAIVLALDDARVTHSRSALAGCSDKVWPAFAAAVAKLPAGSFENVRGDGAIGPLVRDPESYLAANALLACEGSRDQLLWYLQKALEYWPGFRGPRTAAITAITAANIELDDRRDKLSLPYFHLSLEIGSGKSPYIDSGATGVIAKVSERGDAIEVSFVKTSELQDHCLSERETNKIVRIDSSGNLIRERVCTSWAKERTDTTPKPVTLDKRYGGALQKGRYVSILGGTPLGVWAKPNSPTPLAVFGVQLSK